MNEPNEQNHALRFTDIPEGPGRIMPPILGFMNMPLVTLEKAVEPLVLIVPHIKNMVWTVKPNCENPLDNLSPDESASIMLYTLEWPLPVTSFYLILNNILGAENRVLLEPWFLYLKLFITALSKLPSERRLLYRGVKLDMSAAYPSGTLHIWWRFSSCTSSINTLESDKFLGTTGTRTLFSINCHTGKQIRQHSMYPKEDEVLLLAARQLKVVSSMNAGNGLTIIQIEEIDPLYPLLELPPANSTSAPAKPLPPPSTNKTHGAGPYRNETLMQTIRKCQSQKLNLSGQQLNDQDMNIVIKEGIIDKKYVLLDLTYNQVTQWGVRILADALRSSKCLEELIISHNSISDAGVRFLAAAVNSSILKRVDLEENDISNEGAKYLAEMLATNANLLRLSLSHNQIGNSGVNLLADVVAHHNTRLEFLNLSANQAITDECIDSLVNMMQHNGSLKKTRFASFRSFRGG